MNVIIYNRNFQAELAPLPVPLKVGRYSHAALGGPKTATIYTTIQTEESDIGLWGLVERLRCPVEIWSDKGDCVWWGYIAEISLELGAIQVGVSIDSMSNSIAVAYSLVTAGQTGTGSRGTTDWGEDSDSVSEYGKKELLQTTSGSTAAHALAARDMLLAQKRYPIPVIRWEKGSLRGERRATLTCRGWFDAFSWRYAPVPTRLAYEFSTGSVNFKLGEGITKIAQLVEITSTNIIALSVQLRKVGSPTNSVSLALCLEDGANPGTELASGTIAAVDIAAGTYAWHTVTFSAAVLAGDFGGRVYLVIYTSQDDASNYFEVLTGSGYDLGTFHQYTESAWSEVVGADMIFRIYADDLVETSLQVRSLAATYGQFLTGVDLDVASGLTVESYRDGDATASYEITELLKMGTSNNRRMLARVNQNRKLVIYEEPTATNPYFLLRDGSLNNPFDVPLRKDLCPVACWARVKDVIPQTVDVSKLSDPTLVFIEENEYDVVTETLQPTPRGIESAWDLARIKDG